MSRAEFMERLEKLLQNISASEREEALQYYNDYFDDAGAENEGAVIGELVSPEQVAQKIMAGLSDAAAEFSEQGHRDTHFDGDGASLAVGQTGQGAGKDGRCRKKKSFMKVCLILAASLAGIGIVAIGVGMAMGARPSQFLDLVHYSGNIVHLPKELERSGEALEERGEDKRSEEVPERIHEDTGEEELVLAENADSFEAVYGNANTRKLELELNYAVVHIRSAGESGDIFIEGRNAKQYLQITDREGELKLRDTRTFSQYQKDQALELTIYLPERSFEEIELELGSSEIDIEKLEAIQLDVDLGAGELEAAQLVAQEATLEVGVGDAFVETLTVTQEAELSVGIGALEVAHFAGGDLKLDCGVGTLSVTAEGQKSDYNYELECGLGRIQIEDEVYSSLHDSEKHSRIGARSIEIDCGVGEVTLGFES